MPDEDQPKLKNLETVLTGLLLGQDLRTRILPQLGPGVIAYVESPPDGFDQGRAGTTPASAPSSPFAQVLVVSLQKDESGRSSPAAPVTTRGRDRERPSHGAFLRGAR